MYYNNSTIKSLINYGKQLTITSVDLHTKTVIENTKGEKFIVNMNALFERYYDILLDTVETVTLTETEYLKYRFKPKLLSNDLYGTPELHFMLLRLNNMCSVTEFDTMTLKVFGTGLVSTLNEIMIKESDNYIDNEMSIIKEINNG